MYFLAERCYVCRVWFGFPHCVVQRVWNWKKLTKIKIQFWLRLSFRSSFYILAVMSINRFIIGEPWNFDRFAYKTFRHEGLEWYKEDYANRDKKFDFFATSEDESCVTPRTGITVFKRVWSLHITSRGSLDWSSNVTCVLSALLCSSL